MQLLKSPLATHIRTKATPSVPARCTNLKRFVSQQQSNTAKSDDSIMSELVESIGRKFWAANHDDWSLDHLFEYVDPDQVGGLDKNISELYSWEHVFGHTPKFVVNVEIDKSRQASVDLSIENGLIVGFEIHGHSGSDGFSSPTELDEFKTFLGSFVQSRFDHMNLKKLVGDCESKNVYISKFNEFLNKYI